MANSADPDQLAEASWSGATVCWGWAYLGSAGQGSKEASTILDTTRVYFHHSRIQIMLISAMK